LRRREKGRLRWWRVIFAPNRYPSHAWTVDKMAAVINASIAARVAAPKVRFGD
jgi:hypothetical protein